MHTSCIRTVDIKLTLHTVYSRKVIFVPYSLKVVHLGDQMYKWTSTLYLILHLGTDVLWGLLPECIVDAVQYYRTCTEHFSFVHEKQNVVGC